MKNIDPANNFIFLILFFVFDNLRAFFSNRYVQVAIGSVFFAWLFLQGI